MSSKGEKILGWVFAAISAGTGVASKLINYDAKKKAKAEKKALKEANKE